jgi:uncharacterized protein YbjQ (UPF0145 family)
VGPGVNAARPDWRTAGWPIPVTTSFGFAEFEVSTTIGVVSGVYATSLGFARGFTSGITSMARGEVPQMTEQLAEGRHHALSRCVAEAQRHGGNALTGVRFDSNEVGQGGIIEFHCYGTAVLVGPRDGGTARSPAPGGSRASAPPRAAPRPP